MERKIRIPDGVYRDIETGKLVKKIESGSGRFHGMSHWQPMKRGLFSWVPDYSKESFWYDNWSYEKVPATTKCRKTKKEKTKRR